MYAALLTCWWPGLDVSCAVDHGILGLSFFHRAKAIPKERISVTHFQHMGMRQDVKDSFGT
jgi:hypothetical protein